MLSTSSGNEVDINLKLSINLSLLDKGTGIEKVKVQKKWYIFPYYHLYNSVHL